MFIYIYMYMIIYVIIYVIIHKYIYILLFREPINHLHMMVLDVQYNELSARVAFNVVCSIISGGVAQVQHSEGLGSPCLDPCVRVGSRKRRGALLCGSGGPWCIFDWRRKGKSQGPLPVLHW